MKHEVKTTPEAYRNLTYRLRSAVHTILTPPPRLQLSEWANENRQLSRESSPEPGRFRWQRAPYMKEMLDVAGDYRTQKMVIMSSAQVGKTTILENVIANYIANDPSPILMVLPELMTAKAFSTDRLDPMLRDTPVLKGRVKEKRSRDSGNTLLQKRFLGGHLTIIGANSASGLRSRPIRVLLMDEVDAYPISAGKEGDPVNLAIARTSNYWNRKIILTSTPTIKDLSRIEKEFKASDQRYYHVPCPHCGEFDKLTWKRIKWDNDDPNTTHLVCLKNGCVIEEADKLQMLREGMWIADNPSSETAGFHLNALYSPWKTWKELVAKWLEDKKDKQTLQVFINTVLGETWDDAGERVEIHHLAKRLEQWDHGTIPNGVGVLVAGVDVQAEWIEAYVWGFGHKEEAWLIDRIQVFQNPGNDSAWDQLSTALLKRYRTATGAEVGIRGVAIDTGHQSERVFRFVKAKKKIGWQIIPVKGAATPNAPILQKTPKVFSVGTNAAKDLIHSRWQILEAGPGYIHLPNWVDVDVLDQLTSERRITKYKSGRAYRVWENPQRRRNEALDCLVYAMAALQSLGPQILPMLGQLAQQVASKVPDGDSQPQQQTPQDQAPAVTQQEPVRRIPIRRRPLNSGWKTGWEL